MSFRSLLAALAFMAPVPAAVLANATVTIDGAETITSAQRVTRNGVASVFASQKPFPGLNSCPGTCFYRTVTVIPQESHVTIAMTGPVNSPIFVVAYEGSFNVANLATNYLGDPGNSGVATMQVNATPGVPLILTFVNAAGLGSVQFQASDLSVGSAPIPSTLLLTTFALALILAWAFVRAKSARTIA